MECFPSAKKKVSKIILPAGSCVNQLAGQGGLQGPVARAHPGTALSNGSCSATRPPCSSMYRKSAVERERGAAQIAMRPGTAPLPRTPVTSLPKRQSGIAAQAGNAAIPDAGETTFQILGGSGSAFDIPDPTVVFDIVGYPGAPEGDAEAFLKPATVHESFAQDLPEADRWLIAASQRPITLGANTTGTEATAWKTIPSWTVIGTEDRVIPPATQRRMAERAGSTITEVAASHVSMVRTAGRSRSDRGNCSTSAARTSPRFWCGAPPWTRRWASSSSITT